LSEAEKSRKSASDESPPAVLKGAGLGAQAEQLVKVRREHVQAEKRTRLEQLESEGKERAEKIIADAESKANEIINAGKKEADEIRRKSHQEGTVTAKREVLDRLSALISQMENEIHRLQDARENFLNANLPEIVNFACTLSKQILLAELNTHPEILIERLKTLINRMPKHEGVVISVSLGELELVNSHMEEIKSDHSNVRMSLKGSQSVTPGSIRLESDSGLIDAPLIESLDEIGATLIRQAAGQSGRPSASEADDVA